MLVIATVDHSDDVPSHAGATITIGHDGTIGFSETGAGETRIDGITPDQCPIETCERVARTLAPLRIRSTGAPASLDSAGLVELLARDGAGLLQPGRPLVLAPGAPQRCLGRDDGRLVQARIHPKQDGAGPGIEAAPHGLEPIREPGLREIDYGHWEGLRRSEIEARFADEYEAWQEDPFTIAPSDGESGVSVLNRALPVMRRIVEAGVPLYQLGVRAMCAEEAAVREQYSVEFLDADILVPGGIAEVELPAGFPEQVFFTYTPGRTRDLRPHVHVYALRSNVRWSVKGGHSRRGPS